MAEYRIMTDTFLGYEVQTRSWLLPIWHQPRVNTHRRIEDAEEFARDHARRRGRVVKHLGRLPAHEG